MNKLSDVARVIGVSAQSFEIEIVDVKEYTAMDIDLNVGDYLIISSDETFYEGMIGCVEGFRIKDPVPHPENDEVVDPTFILELQLVGSLVAGKFERGGRSITIPPKFVRIALENELESIFGNHGSDNSFSFSTLVQDEGVSVHVDGNKFLSKHTAIVGSSGSGKSTTVAGVLQSALNSSRDAGHDELSNAHVVLFDLHGEYHSAFPEASRRGSDDLSIPYWILNGEELESLFFEGGEVNSRNQVSQFRYAVVENRRHHNPDLDASLISYDTPVYFSIKHVFNYLSNLNSEMIYKVTGENFDMPKLRDGTFVKPEDRLKRYFDQRVEFAVGSSKAAEKTVQGPFCTDFDRLVPRMANRLSDSRLAFLFGDTEGSTSLGTDDFKDIIAGLVGYGDKKANITIFDLSDTPYEFAGLLISLITRMVFGFSSVVTRGAVGNERLAPVVLVYEEAHRYVSSANESRIFPARRSIERIAKEGRKYGLSVMIVSQRPSEVSETVLSQCSNFVAMRLTNPADQSFISRLLPDVIGSLTQQLPALRQREALLIGDAVAVPALVYMDDVKDRPASSDIQFYDEWRRDWADLDLVSLLSVWRS